MPLASHNTLDHVLSEPTWLVGERAVDLPRNMHLPSTLIELWANPATRWTSSMNLARGASSLPTGGGREVM
jgi:hypothetical protein